MVPGACRSPNVLLTREGVAKIADVGLMQAQVRLSMAIPDLLLVGTTRILGSSSAQQPALCSPCYHGNSSWLWP